MVERTIEIEIEGLMIVATISFSRSWDEENNESTFEYEEEHAVIISVTNINEGELMPIKHEHYLLIEKYFETNDVFEQL